MQQTSVTVLHESATFWQSKNIDPTNKNYSTVIIRNVTGMNFLNFISFTLFEWGNGENVLCGLFKKLKPILAPCKCRTIELPDWVTVGPLCYAFLDLEYSIWWQSYSLARIQNNYNLISYTGYFRNYAGPLTKFNIQICKNVIFTTIF